MRGQITKMAWSKNAKGSSSFEKERKYAPMYLLNQTGGWLLLQSGLYINIGEKQQNTYTKVAKT